MWYANQILQSRMSIVIQIIKPWFLINTLNTTNILSCTYSYGLQGCTEQKQLSITKNLPCSKTLLKESFIQTTPLRITAPNITAWRNTNCSLEPHAQLCSNSQTIGSPCIISIEACHMYPTDNSLKVNSWRTKMCTIDYPIEQKHSRAQD